MLDGVVVVDKPRGMTSHDVVDAARRRLGTRKVGHAGTLDPDATGLLILGAGRATRFLAYAQAAPKAYDAVAQFGAVTSTQDASGEVLERRDVDVTRADVERALAGLVGEIEQVPPMVSAVKVGGERLYRLARRGEEVERGARRVIVYAARVTAYDGEAARAAIEVECSAGTYVRTLVHDLGITLGCGAHLAELRRTRAGGFTLDDAISLDAVSPEVLRPLADAVRVLPSLQVDAEEAEAVRHGRPLRHVAPGPVAVLHDGNLMAVYRPAGEDLVADRVVGS